MEKWLGMVCVFILTCSTVIYAQESKVKFDVFGGISNPLKEYKIPVGRAQSGHFMGASLDYYFIEGMIGFGADVRVVEHSHNPSDTLLAEGTAMFISNYSTDHKFRYKGVFVGPIFQTYIGRLGIEMYLKGGKVSQEMPKHDRHMIFFMGQFLMNEKVFVTTHPEKSNSFGVIGGFRINYKITNWLGLSLMGDYQDHFGQPYEIKGLHPEFNYPKTETPEGVAKVKMMNFGVGLKFMFGGRSSWDSLSEL